MSVTFAEDLVSSTQEFLRAHGLSPNSPEARALVKAELGLSSAEEEEIFGHGPLRSLLDDPAVTEILVNGPDAIWAERNGKLGRTDLRFRSEESLRQYVRRILSFRGRKVDNRAPCADAILEDGSRLHVVIPPVAKAGICLSIRKFPSAPWTLAQFVANGTLTPSLAAYLADAVRAHKNIFLSGGTGTGKTSLLAALMAEAAGHERLVALEDVAELRTLHPHFISLEGRPANQEGEGEISLRRLLKEALRMRPDRIIFGECRGDEALDLLLALNSGHLGSMGTLHANSPREALQRLETLASLGAANVQENALKQLVLGGVQLVIQLTRGPNGRRISSVAELKGLDSGRFMLREVPLG
ncbi:MAG: CpaF family protein [Proteobacteria bacterium]|nr:MAG: CpaF family protein [Pseudomonadota bacterium]